MKHISTFKIVITSLFAALICVATMLVQIPIPATGGYANLGDCVILICSCLMHPVYAVIAAGLGSMLADIFAGYAAYAPATLIIKAGVALVAALIFRRFAQNRSLRAALPVMIVAAVLAEAVMVLGYFFYEAVIMGYGAAAAGGIIGNVAQGIVAVVAACVVTPVLMKSEELSSLMKKTWQ